MASSRWIAACWAILALLCCLASSAASVKDAKRTDVSQWKLRSPETPQGQEGAFWRTDHNFDAVMRIKNVLLNQALDVTPELYLADGAVYRLTPVHLEAAGIAQVNIRNELDHLPASLKSHLSEFGMAGVEYKWSWPAVIVTVQNTDEILSLSGVSAANADLT